MKEFAESFFVIEQLIKTRDKYNLDAKQINALSDALKAIACIELLGVSISEESLKA